MNKNTSTAPSAEDIEAMLDGFTLDTNQGGKMKKFGRKIKNGTVKVGQGTKFGAKLTLGLTEDGVKATGRGLKKAGKATVNTDLATVGKGIVTGTKATGKGLAKVVTVPEAKLQKKAAELRRTRRFLKTASEAFAALEADLAELNNDTNEEVNA